MDIIVTMSESEQQLKALIDKLVEESEDGWTMEELCRILGTKEWTTKKIRNALMDHGYMKSGLGYRKFRNGVTNMTTVYWLTDKGRENAIISPCA